MNASIIIGILNIVLGILISLFYKKIMHIQGPSIRKSDFSREQRERKFKIGAVCAVFLGLLGILKGLGAI